jgi:two-component system chemotaxis response regulator CheY
VTQEEEDMGKKILIVDDSLTVRQQVGLALTEAGFEVIEAVDGQEGAEIIGSTDDISAVICDVNMPRLNGIEMVSQVKSDAKNADLPIIMLTTEGQPALIRQAKAAGAKGWIVKPFKAAQLVATMHKIAA